MFYTNTRSPVKIATSSSDPSARSWLVLSASRENAERSLRDSEPHTSGLVHIAFVEAVCREF